MSENTVKRSANHRLPRKALAALLSKTLAVLVSVTLVTTPAYAAEVIEGADSGAAQATEQVAGTTSSTSEASVKDASVESSSGSVGGAEISNEATGAPAETAPSSAAAADAGAAVAAGQTASATGADAASPAATSDESAGGSGSPEGASSAAAGADPASAKAADGAAAQVDQAGQEATAIPETGQVQAEASDASNRGDATSPAETTEQDNATQANAPGQETPAADDAKAAADNQASASVQAAPKAATARTAKAAAPKLATMAATAKDTGDFVVEGDEDSYDFNEGVLIVRGDVTVKTDKETAHRIEVVENAVLTLAGVNIKATNNAAIKIAAGVEAVMTLVANTINTVTGAANYAGVEVEWKSSDNLASLTIEGDGTLNATGGTYSAGIGGSKKNSGVHGNITIESGTINANGATNGAGIGTSDNPGNGTSTGSYKYVEDRWGTITINGGTVNAFGKESGAGIGGGNHSDSGTVIINGGTVVAEGHTGIGSGLGSSKPDNDAKKGPGYYFADVTINGGNVTATALGNAAGIGGGMYGDAKVTITGGTVFAYGGKGSDNYHHGGAGVGAGYMGHAEVNITGGTVYAIGGRAAAGIGSGAAPNNSEARGSSRRGGEVTVSSTNVSIGGDADVTAIGGDKGGAGIGGGVGADSVSVEIAGGTVRAYGASSNADDMRGGAGIGSGFNAAAISTETKYMVDTELPNISITGGNVTAIGGWGASGIGSGAANKQAVNIVIDAVKANIEAYADGTKFAIDTRVVNADGSTSQADNTSIDGNVLQGTFVHAFEQDGVEQGTEGLKDIEVTNEQSGEVKVLTGMLEGYRSFATTVTDPGTFTVFTADEGVANGEGRYFAKFATDQYNPTAMTSHDARYEVTTGSLSDNNYLFPVKSVVVRKVIDAPADVAEQVNETFYFALWIDTINDYLRKSDGSIWVEPIKVVNGQAVTSAKFIGVDDMTFGVWEVANAQGDDLPDVAANPLNFGKYRLVGVTTRHGETDDNDATIDKRIWTDSVSVINTFESVEDDQPGDQPDPSGTDPEPDPDPETNPDPGIDPDPDPTDDPANDGDPESGAGVVPASEQPGTPGGGTPTDAGTGAVDGPAPGAAGAVPAVAAAVPAAPAAPVVPAVAAVVPAPAPAAAVGIQDNANPLADGEAIADDANPLAGVDIDCWVHWWILLGILVTVIYSAVVIVRRQKKSSDLAKMDRDTMNGTRDPGRGDQPVVTRRPQPAISASANS